MTNTAKALYKFWSGFGIPAFVEDTVPDDVQLPYITYQLAEPEWRDPTPLYARIWYKDPSLVQVTNKAKEVKLKIGEGISIPTDDGCVVINKGTPFLQFQPYETDNDVKVAYVNLMLQSLTN